MYGICVCVCVRFYVCMYAYMYICICEYMYTFLHTRALHTQYPNTQTSAFPHQNKNRSDQCVLVHFVPIKHLNQETRSLVSRSDVSFQRRFALPWYACAVVVPGCLVYIAVVIGTNGRALRPSLEHCMHFDHLCTNQTSGCRAFDKRA